jgi:hypothetical protein
MAFADEHPVNTAATEEGILCPELLDNVGKREINSSRSSAIAADPGLESFESVFAIGIQPVFERGPFEYSYRAVGERVGLLAHLMKMFVLSLAIFVKHRTNDAESKEGNVLFPFTRLFSLFHGRLILS